MDDNVMDPLLEDMANRIILSLQAVVAHNSCELPGDCTIKTSLRLEVVAPEGTKFDCTVKFNAKKGEVQYER